MKRISITLALLFCMSATQRPAHVQGTIVCTLDHPSENIVVFLTGTGIPAPQPPKEPAVIDQRHLQFHPHVVPVVPGTTVSFPNSDPVYHNVYSPSKARMFNLGTFAPGVTRSVIMDRAGVVKILCNVHPEMLAFAVVLNTPYFAGTNKSGFFRIDNVPSGKYELNFWCEHKGFQKQDIALTAGQAVTVSTVLHSKEASLKQKELPEAEIVLSARLDCHSAVTH